MSHFGLDDKDLSAAFPRLQPPAGFAERLLARIPEDRSGWWHRLFTPGRSWIPAAAAALIALACTGAWEYQRAERQRLEGERARAELVYALELTSAKLHAAKVKLLRTTGRGNI